MSFLANFTENVSISLMTAAAVANWNMGAPVPLISYPLGFALGLTDAVGANRVPFLGAAAVGAVYGAVLDLVIRQAPTLMGSVGLEASGSLYKAAMAGAFGGLVGAFV